MGVQCLRDYYKCHVLVPFSLVLILMTMSEAFRLGKYPSVLALDIFSVQFSTHEHV